MTNSRPRISRLKIEKFRAIRNAEVFFHDQTAILGPNGSGKTSILRALNCFFNFKEELTHFANGSHRFGSTTQSVIEVEIENLPQTSELPTTHPGSGKLVARLRYKKSPIWEYNNRGQWLKAPADFHSLLSEHVSYVLVPIRRDHGVVHGDGESLLQQAAEAWVNANRQRDRLSPQIRQLGHQLHKRLLGDLEKKLRLAAPLSGPFHFQVRYRKAPDYLVLLNDLEMAVAEGSNSFSLDDAGSGTQSMAVFALYSALAELQNKSFIIGFEEPEQNLHPQAQRQLVGVLQELSLQVAFTTHSPTVVDALRHEQVVRCIRLQSSKRGVEVQVAQLQPDFFQRHSLDADKYYRFHAKSNGEFMFADFVVVVEGVADSLVIKRVLGDGGLDPAANGLSIVSLDGVTAIAHMYHLLKELKIPAVYVVDKDYFLHYSNNKLEDSRDSAGYPTYQRSVKPGTLLPEILPNEESEAFATALALGKREAHQKLEIVGFFCMRYSLEIDLVKAPTTCKRLLAQLELSPDTRPNYVLTKLKSSIKEPGNLLETVDNLDARSLPETLKAIRREVPKRLLGTRP